MSKRQYANRLSKRSKMKHLQNINMNRYINDIFVLCFIIGLFIIAILPLFSIKKVFFPDSEEEKEKYNSLGVKIPFGILCVFSVIVSIFILFVLGVILYCLMGEHTMNCISGSSSFMMMIPSALILYIMLPMYIIYKEHVK